MGGRRRIRDRMMIPGIKSIAKIMKKLLMQQCICAEEKSPCCQWNSCQTRVRHYLYPTILCVAIRRQCSYWTECSAMPCQENYREGGLGEWDGHCYVVASCAFVNWIKYISNASRTKQVVDVCTVHRGAEQPFRGLAWMALEYREWLCKIVCFMAVLLRWKWYW